jgi:hypothetical protein
VRVLCKHQHVMFANHLAELVGECATYQVMHDSGLLPLAYQQSLHVVTR